MPTSSICLRASLVTDAVRPSTVIVDPNEWPLASGYFAPATGEPEGEMVPNVAAFDDDSESVDDVIGGG